jgi:hypothetical protein
MLALQVEDLLSLTHFFSEQLYMYVCLAILSLVRSEISSFSRCVAPASFSAAPSFTSTNNKRFRWKWRRHQHKTAVVSLHHTDSSPGMDPLSVVRYY